MKRASAQWATHAVANLPSVLFGRGVKAAEGIRPDHPPAACAVNPVERGLRVSQPGIRDRQEGVALGRVASGNRARPVQSHQITVARGKRRAQGRPTALLCPNKCRAFGPGPSSVYPPTRAPNGRLLTGARVLKMSYRTVDVPPEVRGRSNSIHHPGLTTVLPTLEGCPEPVERGCGSRSRLGTFAGRRDRDACTLSRSSHQGSTCARQCLTRRGRRRKTPDIRKPPAAEPPARGAWPTPGWHERCRQHDATRDVWRWRRKG
jgi:hypothetical protein